MTAAAHTIAVSATNATTPSHATSSKTSAPSALARWAGRFLTAVPVLFLTFDAAIKLAGVKAVSEGMAQAGWQPDAAFSLGILLLSCVAIYVIPQTAVLGAILLTGYLGGAVATHVRIGNPLFSHVLFPTYVGAMIWGGLVLRDARLRALIPFRRTHA